MIYQILILGKFHMMNIKINIYNKFKTFDLINEKDYFCSLDLFKPFINSGRKFLKSEKYLIKKEI